MLNLTRMFVAPMIIAPLELANLTQLAALGRLNHPALPMARFDTLQKNTTVQPIALNNLVNRFFYAYRKGAVLIRAYTSSMVGYFLGAALLWPRVNPRFYPTAQELTLLPVVTSYSQQVIT
jgi:hypothetical protein